MRNMFALIGLLVVVAGGAGWYLGWYKVNFTKNSEGNLQIQTDVDTNKLSGDSSAFFHKMGQMATEHAQKTGQNANATQPATTPGNTPGPTTPMDTPSQGNGIIIPIAPTTPNNQNNPAPPPPPGGMQ